MKMRVLTGCVLGLLVVQATTSVRGEPSARSEAHDAYAVSLWAFLQDAGYQDWKAFEPETDFAFGPPSSAAAKHYGKRAAADPPAQREGSVVITEHYVSEPPVLASITVRLKRQPGFDPKNDDWYWVHFTPGGKAIKTSADKDPRAKRGFAVFEEEGRLWVFDTGSPELSKYLQAGELAKHVIHPGVGPAGITLKAPDADTITRYVAAKPGFVTILEDGRLWVFRKHAEQLTQFQKAGELAKHVIRPGAGPRGVTLKAPDAETLDSYLLGKPGFVVKVIEERLWVFRDGSDALADFEASGELAKHVIRPSAGPGGITIKAPDAETLDAYLAAQPGFVTTFEDGRLWVFHEGSPEHKDYETSGELAKHVIRPGAGPGGVTVKAPDGDTLDAYLRACGL